MKKVPGIVKAAFSVYNEWNGTKRASKQLIFYTIMFWGSVMVYFFGWEEFDQADAVAVATAIMALIGSGLRIESKGGESVIKPKVREKANAMPEPPGD